KKMGEILRFLSDKRNSFFDFFDIKNVHGDEKQFLQNELNQKKETLQSAMLKFDSNDEFLLFFQKIENSIFVYIVESNASKDLDLSFNHSQKMQVIGNLASGIAHDFNNLLTGMVGFCDLLMAKHSSDKESLSMLIHVKQNIVRAMDLIRKLLTFSKKQLTKIEIIDVKKVIINVIDLLKRIIGENIELNLKYSDEQLLTKIDQSQFEQMIINLVVNARDSIEKNGQINIELSLIDVISDDYKIHPYLKIYSPDGEKIEHGQYILIKIEDNGIGIEESKASKIFEPFYTTRENGEGTGLGLSMIYGMMQNHGGWVTVTSELGHGSEFTLSFPCDVPSQPVQSHELVEDKSDRPLIVVIDDEPFLVDLSVTFLARSNFRVRGFHSSMEAVEWFRDHWQEVSLIILDMKMPHMDGLRCFEALQQIDPHVQVAILSGYIQDYSAQQVLERGALRFFQKPLRYPELIEWVRETVKKGQSESVGKEGKLG
ncbi:MAG: response regulator, partial [Bdellovibrionales bacterium]|nr:response regulator [Bdellovibrionales bacterium]